MNSIKVRFASKEEAQKLILGNTQYLYKTKNSLYLQCE